MTKEDYGILSKKIKEGLRAGEIFENNIRPVLSNLFGVTLEPSKVIIRGSLAKKFDFVSPDRQILGDAKCYKNIKTPAAKFSTIAEYVWLLQNANTSTRFLAFGNDVEVPIAV